MVGVNRHSISSRISSLVDIKLAAILLLIVFSASVPSAFAEFTTTNNAYACDSPSDGLNQIHRISKSDSSIQSSNTMTIDGLPNNSRGCNGLAVDPTSLLYYVIVNVKGGDRYLATIDPETGLGTAIGSMGDNFATLAFKSDGSLYAIGGAGANSPNILQSVNKLTGETTELCEFPPNGPGHNFLGYNWEDETMYRLWGYGADGELFLDAISDEATCSTASSIPVNNLGVRTLSIMNMAFHTNDHDFLFLARDDAIGNTVYWELKINGDAREKHDDKMPDGIDRKGFAFELENNSGTDTDLDTVADKDDNCVFVINPLQIDSDGDGLGDECDGTPTVAINADVTSGRTPLDVSFTCTSQTGNTPFGYSWDFENDTAIDSTMQNTTHTFTSAGVYDVKCTIDDSDNDSDSDYVTINAILPTGGEPDPELLLTINNPTPEKDDHFGTSVSSTLDGNLLVGAPGDNTGGDNAGSAYLFDGVTGALLLTINNPTPEQDDNFGISLGAVSNGNLLVGAPGDNTGGDNAGSAYLFDGVTGALLLTINNPTPEQDDLFGESAWVTRNDDLLIGAPGDNTGGDNAGSAYLFDDVADGLLLTINNPTPEQDDNFGASVSSTRNYDLLIGAPGDNTGGDNAGSAYLFDDVADGLLLTINNPTPKNHDNFGASLSSTRNNDLLIGALNDDTGAGKAGSVYLFDGVTGSLFLTNNNPSAENDDKFGTSIAFTPHNYMVVGEPRNLVSEPAGSVHLYGGHTDSILFTMNNPTPENGDKFGESIAYAQNGNVLIGAPNDNTGADEAGSVYLFDAIVDMDNDGIHDHIDDDEDYFNDSFNDGITDGVIVSRGDQFIKIIDEPDHFGVRIITDSSGGPTPADISICGGASQAFFAAANEVVGTCGSVTWEVISGEINGVIVSIDGETAEFSLKSGDNFYFDDKSFTLQSSEGNAEITLVGDDGTKIKVILSGGNLVSFDSETSIITADPSNTGDVTIIIDDKEITIKPGQTTAPTIIGPDDLTVEATALETPASDVLLGTPDVSGNVDPNPNVVNNEPSTYPLGLTEITWTVTDLTGNSAEDTQLVTLVDTTPPTLVTPDNVEITLEGVLTSVDVGIASAIDTVDSNPSITNDSPFDGFPIGETIVTWTATDFSGNSVLQTQLVTINAPQQGKQDVISELEILQTNANSKHTPIEIGKAIKDIQNSLDSELWVDQINLDPMKGEKVFKEEGDAVIRLLTILGHDDDDDKKKSKETQEFQNQIQNLVDELVIFDRILAQHAIDRAIDEFGGDKKSDKEIDRANKEMTMAQKELDKDKPDKAIDRFEKAWKHAQKAMKHAENDDDDDDDDDENEDNENNDENDDNDD